MKKEQPVKVLIVNNGNATVKDGVPSEVSGIPSGCALFASDVVFPAVVIMRNCEADVAALKC